VFIICAAIITYALVAFGAYQIGYSNGADGNYRLMMQQWEQLEIERDKLESLRSIYSSNCTKD
jgi:hypothetical protein